MTRGLRLFNKNVGGSEPERVCIAVEACPVPVPEDRVQPEEGPVNGGGNSDPLKVATNCLSKIRLYAGKPEDPTLLAFGPVTMRWVQAISRKGRTSKQSASGILRDYTPDIESAMMR